MELWTLWNHVLQAALEYLAAHFGLSEAVSIIVLTLVVRTTLSPISLLAAYRGQQKKEALEALKPKLEALRQAHQGSELAARTLALHREHGITFIDKLTLFNIGTQGTFALGIFQCLRRTIFSSRFLWIANLAKPDLYLTVIVSVLMLLGMAVLPGATSSPSMLLLLAIPLCLSVLAIATMPSALGIYWATSNAITLFQNLVLRAMLAKTRPLGA